MESFSIGGDFISSQSSVTVIDTYTVKMSTVIFDSIPTSGSENLLTGQYRDEFLGLSGVTGYFQINMPAITTVEPSAVFDSITLVLNPAKVSYGDTLKPFSFSVNRVTENIKYTDDNYMYNTSVIDYDENPLGEYSLYPKPNVTDTISIRLSDAFGQELFSMMKNDAEEISTDEKFLKFFRGIALVSGKSNNCVIGFEASDSLVNMVIHAHTVASEKINLMYKFPLASSGIWYNHFYFNRSGTPLKELKTQKEEISSADSDNKAYIQAGAGITTRLDFPGLGKIMEIQKRHYFYKAELIFKPFPLSNKQIPFPEELNFYTCDKFNRLISLIDDSDGNAQATDFNYDEFYNEKSYYSIDITSFIKEELSDSYFNDDNGLLINLPDETSSGTLGRLVLDARENSMYRPILKIYFLFYE
jgi:hypothetical protein